MEFDINQKIVKKAVEYYGEDYMATVCMEECAELVQAISKMKRGENDKYHLAEEMGDVLICIENLQEIYGIENEEIQKWIAGKQGRTLDRMGVSIEEKEYEVLSKRIQAAMESIGISQRQLAKEVGVTETTISRWINGKRIPKATDIVALSKVLQCSCDYLVGV